MSVAVGGIIENGLMNLIWENHNIMKNKGRRHKHGIYGICNTKSMIAYITRPIGSMSSKGLAESKFDKKKWIKRMRGYLKSQTKEAIMATPDIMAD